MTPPAPCSTCGAQIPPDAPGSSCPACLLAAGLGGAAGPDERAVAAAFPDMELLGLIGRGGMGTVFRARQKSLGRVVALKVLAPDAARTPGFTERFRREAQALAMLAHPHIVAIHEFGEREGLCFLVMEHVEGTDVRAAIRSGRLGPADVLRIVPQICDALSFAHARGVVHRDIKPENVLIDSAGNVKVADFGLAKIVAPGDAHAADLTATGQVMGTAHYMAPEQWERPASVDHRADIYSLGVVFYEMLTGELPVGRFDAPSRKVQVDVRVDEVVLRSLERAPERRWQRAEDVREGLERAASAEPPPDPKPVPRTSRLAVASLALVVSGPVLAIIAGLTGVQIAAWIGALATVALSLVGVPAAVAAWVRIRASGGRLTGVGYCVAAIVVAFIAGCAGAFVVTPRTAGPTPIAVSAARRSSADDTGDIANLAERLYARHPFIDRATAMSLYTPEARDRIARMTDDRRDRDAAEGWLNFPLATEEFLGAPLASYAARSIQVDDDGLGGSVTIRSTTRRIRGRVAFTREGWRFTDDPLLDER
ncbi:MAG: Serine/threonine-protein kinase PknD [Planctomycetes bacterium]|nr:Serine/threonine-protein kinase PknD [Planctomycetota bacterium]